MAERVEGIKTVVVAGKDRSKNTIISTKKTAPEDDASSMVDVDKIEAINTRNWKEKLAEYKKKPGSFVLFILVHLAALITVLSIGFLLVYVLVKGIPNLNADIFTCTGTYQHGIHDIAVTADSRTYRNICSDISR